MCLLLDLCIRGKKVVVGATAWKPNVAGLPAGGRMFGHKRCSPAPITAPPTHPHQADDPMKAELFFVCLFYLGVFFLFFFYIYSLPAAKHAVCTITQSVDHCIDWDFDSRQTFQKPVWLKMDIFFFLSNFRRTFHSLVPN